MTECYAICGAPRTGKTTFATKLAQATKLPLISTGKRSEVLEIYTKFFIDLEWDEVPHVVRAELKKYPAWILEGTQSARVLRKWLAEEPETLQLKRVHWFDNAPWVPRNDGQESMAKGVRKIFGEVRPFLRRLSVEVVDGPGGN